MFVVLAVIVIVIVATLGGGKPPKASGSVPTRPAPASIVSAVANVPASELDQAGVGGGQIAFLGSGGHVVALKSGAPLTSGGKPEIVYVGAEFCPFCAATRWGLAIALDKFGTLSGLHITASSPYDFAPNTHTLSFVGTKYSSQYLSFTEIEQVTNVCKQVSGGQCTGGYTSLQSTPASVARLVNTYDTVKYFGSAEASGPGIPFLDMGGKYIESGSPYVSSSTQFPPISMATFSWQQIVNSFAVPTSGVGQAVLAAANHYIAVFCQLTHNAPASVCSLSGVKAVETAGFK